MKIYHIAKGDIESVYCAWCEKLMQGQDIGFNNEQVSHGICERCMHKVIQDMDNSHEDTPVSKEAKQKRLFQAYVIGKGTEMPIPDTFVHAISPAQARNFVKRRGGKGVKNLRRYESYEDYGMAVVWKKVRQDTIEDKPTDTTNNVDEKEKEVPWQMDFLNELGV